MYGKTKPNTTKAYISQSKEMSYNTKKTKARFSRLLVATTSSLEIKRAYSDFGTS